MNDLTRFIEPALAEALGWTLLHALWEGAAIALLLALLLLLSRNRAPQYRYILSVGAMVTLLLAAALTFVWLYEPAATITTGALHAQAVNSKAALYASASGHPAFWSVYFQPHLPLIAGGWLLGVLLLGLRLISEYAYLQHLQHYRCRPASTEWIARLGSLAQQTGVSRPVQMRETARIHSPMVSGVLKPVILMPVGMLNGLSTAEVEQILLHELAHIRRYDYLFNLLIAAVETLFFFHPFVWWIGSRIRTEREHACDDLAIEVSGNAATYVTALAHAESWRTEGGRLSLAFAGGTVLQRVQRILGQQTSGKLISGKAAGAIIVAGWAGLLLVFSTPTQAGQSVPFEPVELTSLSIQETSVQARDAEVETEPAPEPAGEPAPKAEPPLPLRAERDTIPPEPAMEKAVEAEMRAFERAMREQEKALNTQISNFEQELQAKLMAQERALIEMEAELRKAQRELEHPMLELEAQERELQLQQLELEEQQLELERQEEQLEQQMEKQGGNEVSSKQTRKLREQKLELEEAKHRLQAQAIALESRQRQLEGQQTQQERALMEQERALERQMHQMERQRENQVRQLERQRDQMKAELKARKKAMKHRMKEVKRKKKKQAQ